MPDIENYQYDRFLSEVMVRYKNATLIGESIAPVIQVGKREGTYFEFGREGFRVHDTERAPRTRANEVDFDRRSKSFRARQHALIGGLSIEEREESPDDYNPEPDTIENVTDSVNLGREKRISNILRNPANLRNGVQLAGSAQLSDPASDAAGIFEDAMMTVRRNIGRRPNFAIFPFDVMRQGIRNNASLKNQLADNERGIITKRVLAELLEMEADQIFVPEAVEDNSNSFDRVEDGRLVGVAEPGAPSSLMDVWGRDIIFGYKPESGQERRQSPSLAYTFRVRERGMDGTVNRWTEGPRHTDFFEVGRTETTEIVAAGAGYLIRDAIAPLG